MRRKPLQTMWRGQSAGDLLRGLWASPRFWATISTMSNRGVGFVVSLSISRLLDTHALALYISTVITASSVVTPLVQMLFNVGTVGGARHAPSRWLRAFLAFELKVVGIFLPILVAVLGLMQWNIAEPLSEEVGSSPVWLVVVAISAIGGQLLVAAFGGLLNGMNKQLLSYRAQAFVSMFTMLFSFPSVWLAGITGAWVVLICNCWIPVTLLGVIAWRVLASMAAEGGHAEDMPRPAAEAWRQMRHCLPNVLGVAVSGFAGWFCTIKLVSQHHSASGMATLAVANQWLTLILVPVTSWGGVQLRELVGLRLSRQPWGEVRKVGKRLVVRNLAMTGALVALVVLAAPLLERVYRLQGQGLRELLWVSGAVALTATMYGVIESLVIAWERQWILLRLLVAGLIVQVAFTWTLIDRSLSIAQWGTLSAWVTMVGLGVFLVRRFGVDEHR